MKKYDTFDDYKLDHKVISFLEFNSYVIVLFDYMDFPKTEQAKNDNATLFSVNLFLHFLHRFGV